MTQEKIADSWIDLEQFRLLVLRTAWKIDRYHDYKKVRGDIAAIKVLTPRVFHDVTQRAIQLHGALGVSNDLPLVGMMISAYSLGIADGPTEVHKITLAKQILRRSPAAADRARRDCSRGSDGSPDHTMLRARSTHAPSAA